MHHECLEGAANCAGAWLKRGACASNSVVRGLSQARFVARWASDENADGLGEWGSSTASSRGLRNDGGWNVLARSAFVLSVPLMLAGCANEGPSLAGFASTSSLAIAAPAAAVAAPLPPPPTFRKTMSDRVLTAIALERVTGLKPDPSRLSE